MKLRIRNIDFILLATVIALVVFGVVMVYSSGFYRSQHTGGDGTLFLFNQIQGAVIGLIVMGACAFIPMRWLNNKILPYAGIVVSAILLILVLIIGKDINGGYRWLKIGSFQFQPSEIARLALVYFCAYWLAGHGDDIKSKNPRVFFHALAGPGLATLLIFGLILAGRNLSMSASAAIIVMAMLFAAGINMRAFGTLGLFAGGGFALFAIIEPYRLRRMTIFMNPFSDPGDAGYQLVQSLYALGSGGLFGVGLGNSRQKYLHLPYSESDFILSIIGEEFGFLGMLVLLAAYWIVIWRGTRIAIKSQNRFNMLMCAGLTALIAVQLLINVAVVTSTMPPTGVPLPFISAGSTSLVIYMAAVGLLLNVSRDIETL